MLPSPALPRPIPDDGSDPPSIRQLLDQTYGNICYDVGANTGQTARRLSTHFNTINSFEPCHESYTILRDSRPANCVPFPIAVGANDGVVTLTETENAIKSGQLTTGIGLNWGSKTGERAVACMTIDTLTDSLGYPDFIKVDCEGHEKYVIEGAFLTLRNPSPPRLLIEIHFEPNAKAIGQLLHNTHIINVIEHEYLANSPMGQHHFYLYCIPKESRNGG